MNKDKAILLIFLFVGMLTMFGIPLWISVIFVVIVVVIFLIAPTILKISESSSLTSKLPSLPIKTIFYGLLWLAVIIFLLLFIWECLLYIGCLGPEKFSGDTTMKDYEIGGNYVIQDESLKICGNATIFNRDASDEFFGIPLYWEHPDFDIFGVGEGTIRIVMDNGIQKYEKKIIVDGSFKIDFGTGSSYEREDAVYFIMNGISSTIDEPPIYLDTNRPYSVKGYFNGTFSVFEINIGE